MPGLAVPIRRLHDIDKSGWWILIGFIPLIGIIILLLWFVRRGSEGPNLFGDDPLQSIIVIGLFPAETDALLP